MLSEICYSLLDKCLMLLLLCTMYIYFDLIILFLFFVIVVFIVVTFAQQAEEWDQSFEWTKKKSIHIEED